eukprot:15088-Heterococcus_DN1.PRE.2
MPQASAHVPTCSSDYYYCDQLQSSERCSLATPMQAALTAADSTVCTQQQPLLLIDKLQMHIMLCKHGNAN